MSKYISINTFQNFGKVLKLKLFPTDAPITNYIIEQGTTSGGTYRKGSDGFCEAGYHFWQTGVSVSGSTNQQGATISVSIPSTLFAREIDCVYAGATASGHVYSNIGGCDGTKTSGEGHVSIRSGNYSSANIEANLYAVGGWR